MRSATLILAAGGSSRLGQPKQLLPFHGKTLLGNTVEAAMQLPEGVTIVVTGASRRLVQDELRSFNIEECFNENWEAGMSTSIRAGIEYVQQHYTDVNCCIIAVCDQPFISGEVFTKLRDAFHRSDKGIICSGYGTAYGTPVLFSQRYFNELLALKNDEGAKKLLQVHVDDVVVVPFEEGIIDIDTPEDISKLDNIDLP